MKKALALLVILFALFGGYYYWTSNNEIELEEASPLATSSDLEGQPVDAESGTLLPLLEAMDEMEPEVRADFEAQMEEMAELEKVMEEEMPVAEVPTSKLPELVSEAVFQAHAHDVAGKALLIKDGEDYTVRFEDFETINGPDLHIYLSTDIAASDYVDLGKIRATKGSVNYSVPAGTDLERYNHVLVWCEPFRVTFSYAQL